MASNFPDASLRENIDVGKLETSTKYSLAHTSNALSGNLINIAPEDNVNYLTGRNHRQGLAETHKPLTAVTSGSNFR